MAGGDPEISRLRQTQTHTSNTYTYTHARKIRGGVRGEERGRGGARRGRKGIE